MRRDLTMGQRAIWAAKATPVAQRGGDRKSKERSSSKLQLDRFPMVTKDRLSQARTILRYTPELADQVLMSTGQQSFSKAFEQARQRPSVSPSRALFAPHSPEHNRLLE